MASKREIMKRSELEVTNSKRITIEFRPFHDCVP